ncbi:hypothetical protein [Rhodanobacter thiooxydans]|uniref:hypothetical protein n=1 Tax=Rhodanobacter thiooxydans TaxID=416169 RepID=UPI000260D591|nr:hypothetical protein [Rhodanobacter thiooxydans]EIM03317.1 hypothetical protein UUA_00180 [Rhodanobacter thiooxydans LCS2]
MKMRNLLFWITVALSLVACSKTQYQADVDTSNKALVEMVHQADVENAPLVTADPFTPPFADVALEQYLVGVSTLIPADGPNYVKSYNDFLKQEALGQSQAASLSQSTGYPLYPVRCETYNKETACVDSDDNTVPQADLVTSTVLIKNRDAIANPNIECSDIVCVDVASRQVVGHASFEILAWRAEHCRSVPNAPYQCPSIKPFQGQ